MQIYYILCKMSVKFKSNVEVFSLAKQIKARRRELGLTIKLVERYIGVDCGQLSRFEAGKFKTYSKNLQILCKYMQIADWSCKSQDNSIGARLESFAARSHQHKLAAEEILSALERLT